MGSEKLRLRAVLVGAHYVAHCPRYGCETTASVLIQDAAALARELAVEPPLSEPKCPSCGWELDPDFFTLHAEIRFEEDDRMSTQMQEELIEAVLAAVLEVERGYVNNPADRGGPTKYGITLKMLARHREVEPDTLTAADVEALTIEEARAILRIHFIEGPGFLEVRNPFLFHLLIDAGVHHGPGRPISWLQEALSVAVDGVLGPKTIMAIRGADIARLARRVLAARFRFFGQIITDNRTDADHDGITDNAEFAKGWLRRGADFIERLP